MGIIIGTLILWVLTAVAVIPLTNMSLGKRLAAEGVGDAEFERLPAEEKKKWEGIATGYYIMWDVIVLGIAGLIGGLMGFWFIGISLEARGWPGMIVFIGASFLGLAMSGTSA